MADLQAQTDYTFILPLKLHSLSDEVIVFVAPIESYPIIGKVDSYFKQTKVFRLSASTKNLVEKDSKTQRRLVFGN